MNKNIYILWFQGFENSPEIIKRCVDSWKYYNLDWNIILLDNTNISNYINIEEYIDITNKDLNFITLSDIVRVILLDTYGGLWVDATTFCNRPLNEWLFTYINQGFFAFSKPSEDKLISNWFLYSEKGNYITNTWLRSMVNYCKIHTQPHLYHWPHYVFGDLYNSDKKFSEIWDKVIKFSANGLGPHYLQEKKMFNRITSEIKNDIDNKITPLYKLTYKCNFTNYNETTNLHYLYSTINPSIISINDITK
jgi:hypothetical protein